MINTERLSLMIPSSLHLIELYNICSHPQANIYTPKGMHSSKFDTQRWIEKWRNHWQQYQFGYFVLVKKIDCSVIGICGYEYRQLKQETVLNLFYKLHPDFEGHGYAYEAIIAITNFVDHIDYETTKVIRTNKYNHRSIQLAKKLKFKRDDTMDDIINKGDIVFYK
ncbi:GNAT family N-acetyltransferase [Staphylococcus argenteus]|uniref:GNAT family N-acetyltransferase n=1 Tax=Staphylococcus argenteus TaxID=985002 RepID=UPI000C2C7764|nr:GNAT family protein [Staphylococcus argenteus]ATY58122.1 GNAT family N-acetyltransferase [Staphylococcus argenteus]ATZ88346.1 N-acetyltransferase [Staphylococcus argenteus]